MGVASLVIGIISFMIGFVPCCGNFALLPAVVGTGLGISDIAIKGKSGEPRGMAVAGVVLNVLAIIVIFLWNSVFLLHGKAVSGDDFWQQTQQQSIPTVPIHPPKGQPVQPAQPVPRTIPTVPVKPAPSPPDSRSEPVPPNHPMQPMEPVQPEPPPPGQP